MKVVSTKLDEKTLRVLKALAAERGWTVSQIIRHYLQKLARVTPEWKKKIMK